MQDFSNRTAVVTGAASGIGRGLALAFAHAGARVVAADVDADGLDETATICRAAGAAVMSAVVDVRSEVEVQSLADRVDEEFGGTDVLCNNAGVFRGGLVWENPVADWEWVFSVNLYGIVHGLRAFVPRMLARGAEGHIVNTASMAGLIASGMSGIYTVSKFAVVALSETLARDLQSVGAPIGVSVLCPSAVATQIGASQRNRADVPGPDAGADAIEQILRDFCAAGAAPEDVGELVLAAVRRGEFLIPTRDTFGGFLETRNAALLRRELPPFQMFD